MHELKLKTSAATCARLRELRLIYGAGESELPSNGAGQQKVAAVAYDRDDLGVQGVVVGDSGHGFGATSYEFWGL